MIIKPGTAVRNSIAFLLLIIMAVSFMTGCGPTGVVIDATHNAPSSVTVPADNPPQDIIHHPVVLPPATLWGGNAAAAQWTQDALTALDELGINLIRSVPTDITTYCPNYRALDYRERRGFWVALMSALAEYESNYRPETLYKERFNDAHGSPVISRGMLQISIESANSYGCGITHPSQLHDVRTNLRCGVRILNRWVGERDNVISAKHGAQWRGAARYWSPFRDAEKRTGIAATTSATPYCR